ncbi:hypothetical protein SAMN04487866_1239 [Thermoactinomyces sp. DSM 45891]|nr:hypothetical protein [Thermoactinomyces sp. DSM 45891]SFX76029.1 hypothetical protein SAMN04487866_1239 [Thermoactinomyces sp. DSM 45891]
MKHSANKMEEFDKEIYQMHSPNNMMMVGEFEPLEADEQKKIEQAFKTNN